MVHLPFMLAIVAATVSDEDEKKVELTPESEEKLRQLRDEMHELVRRLESIARAVAINGKIKAHVGPPGSGTFIHQLTLDMNLPIDWLMEKDEIVLKGAAVHEAGHAAITRYAKLLPEEELERPGLGFLLNTLDDTRLENWAVHRFPGTMPWISKLNVEKFPKPPAGITPEMAWSTTSKARQFGLAHIHEWWFGTVPEGIHPEVVDALAATKDARFDYVEKLEPPHGPDIPRELVGDYRNSRAAKMFANEDVGRPPDTFEKRIRLLADEGIRLVMDEIWPVYEKLVEPPVDKKEIEKLLEEIKKLAEKAENREPKDASDELEKAVGQAKGGKPITARPVSEEELKELLDQMSDEQKKELKELLERIKKAIENGEPIVFQTPEEEDEHEHGHGEGQGEEKEGEAKGKGQGATGRERERERGREREAAKPDREAEVPQDVGQDLGIDQPQPEQPHGRDPRSKPPRQKKREIRRLPRAMQRTLEELLREEAKAAERRKDELPPAPPEPKPPTSEVDPEIEQAIREIVFEQPQTDYDRAWSEVLPLADRMFGELERILRPESLPTWQTGFETGQRLALPQVMQLQAGQAEALQRMWQRRIPPSVRDPVVMLLIDLSGSMSEDDKAWRAFYGATLMAEVLHRLLIPFAVLGFQDADIVTFKAFTDPHDTTTRDRIAEIPSWPSRGNADGPALMKAAEELLSRPEATKILIAISDGMPSAGRDPEGDLHRAVEAVTKAGIMLVGVGLGPGTEHVAEFYPEALASAPLDEFPEALGEVLEKVILGEK